MNINRQSAGTVIAGAAAGGQFAASSKTEADGSVLTAAPAPPDPRDDVSLEELDEAVDFTNRDDAIRALWDQDGPEAYAAAQEQSAALVKDSLKWRYPDATSALLTEADGKNLFIAELRDRAGKPIAWDHQMGGVEQGAVDYSGVTFLDVELSEHLWAHVDGLPRSGKNAPQKVPGDQLRGVGEGSSDTYRLPLRDVQPSKRERFEAADMNDADWEEGVHLLAVELGNRMDPELKDMDQAQRINHILENGREHHREVGRLAAEANDRNMVARLHRIGATHPLEIEIEKDWTDSSRREDRSATNPWSYAAQRENLDRASQMRRELNAKTMKPSQIIGTGYRSPRKQAFEYLDRMEADAQRAIDTRGRSLVGSRFSANQLRAAADQVRAEFADGRD